MRLLHAARFHHGPLDGNLWNHHTEGAGPVAHPASQVFAIKDVEDLELLVATFLLVAILVAWLAGRCRTVVAEADVTTKTKQQDVVIGWLGTLSVVTAALLLLQVGLGYISGSLTLLADLAHGAGDTVTYAAAFAAEKVKRDLSKRSGATAYVAKLDLLAGITSTLLVAGVCSNAMWDAWKQLGPHKGTSSLTVESQLIGPAILNFAVVSLAANMGLLLFRFQGQQQGAADAAAVPPPPPPFHVEAGDVPPPPQPITPPGGRAGRRRSPRQQQKPQENQPEGQKSGGTKWLHAMFHPGCECADHSLQGAPEQTHENNLNLFGATLHLATDVLRSVLVLIVGLLLQAGILTNVERTDAVCALVVGACVLFGTVGFFVVPFAQALEQLPSFGSQV